MRWHRSRCVSDASAAHRSEQKNAHAQTHAGAPGRPHVKHRRLTKIETPQKDRWHWKANSQSEFRSSSSCLNWINA